MLTTVETYELRSRRDVYGLFLDAPAMTKKSDFFSAIFLALCVYAPILFAP
jgi:hypothetical protein